MSELYNTFFSQMVGVLTNPRDRFQNISENDFRKSLYIIIAAIILSTLAGNIYLSKIPAGTLPLRPSYSLINPTQLKRNITTIQIVGNIVSILISWVLPTAIIHLLSVLSGNFGSIKRILTMTGFAYTPMLIQHGIRLIDAYTISPLQVLTLIVSGNFEIGIMGIITQILKTYTIFRIVSLVLYSYAISANYNMSRIKSTLIAFSSYIVFLIPISSY